MPTSVRRWIVILLAAGGLTVGALTFSGNLLPSSDNSVSVGSSSARVANVYTANLYANSASSSDLTIGSGNSLDFVSVSSVSINADSLSVYAGTSTQNLGFTGVGTSDICLVGLRGDWSANSSTVQVSCSFTAANVAKLYFQSTTATAVDLSPATYDIVGISF